MSLLPKDAMGRLDLEEACVNKGFTEDVIPAWTFCQPRECLHLPGRRSSLVTRRIYSHPSVRCGGHKDGVEVTCLSRSRREAA